eukprot:scaffold3984_cov103-Isochrysis_galbana.AAC.2
MREQVERVVAKGGSRPAERLARPAREDGLEVWQRRHARARFLSGGACARGYTRGSRLQGEERWGAGRGRLRLPPPSPLRHFAYGRVGCVGGLEGLHTGISQEEGWPAQPLPAGDIEPRGSGCEDEKVRIRKPLHGHQAGAGACARRTKLAENLVELVDLGVSGEQGRSAGELGEDATGGPDVNCRRGMFWGECFDVGNKGIRRRGWAAAHGMGRIAGSVATGAASCTEKRGTGSRAPASRAGWGRAGLRLTDVEVVLCAEQELWSSVPQRDHLVGVELLVGGLRGARQPKVSQLDEAGVIDEHVLRLQVAVQDPPGVAKRQAAQYLEQAALDEGGWHAAAELGVEARLEVVVKVLEHQVDARRHRHKFTHAHNVDMVQCGDGHALVAVVEPDLLERNNRLARVFRVLRLVHHAVRALTHLANHAVAGRHAAHPLPDRDGGALRFEALAAHELVHHGAPTGGLSGGGQRRDSSARAIRDQRGLATTKSHRIFSKITVESSTKRKIAVQFCKISDELHFTVLS